MRQRAARNGCTRNSLRPAILGEPARPRRFQFPARARRLAAVGFVLPAGAAGLGQVRVPRSAPRRGAGLRQGRGAQRLQRHPPDTRSRLVGVVPLLDGTFRRTARQRHPPHHDRLQRVAPHVKTRTRLEPIALILLAIGLLFPEYGRAMSAVTAGNARFEFLTSTLVRIEYASSGKFVDVQTAVVEKRDWPDVEVHQKTESGWLVASTDAMTLRYKLQSGAFSATNLEVNWTVHGETLTWHPGQIDNRNLGGLTYSLDNVRSKNLPKDEAHGSPVDNIIPGIDVLLPQAQPGLLSRSGYAFIDDSKTPLWNEKTQWIEPRESNGAQDWYLFVYGRDYRKALAEYAQLCGPIPMIPRYVLGPMITDLNFEYFPGSAETKTTAFGRYGEEHLEDEVARFRQSHIPLDTLVLDFAWHNYGWDGGYDWSPLIPHPDQLLKWLHDRGIRVSLNDHPGYANTQENILSPEDSHAPEVLRALGEPLPPKASFDLDLSRGWQFAVDPRDQGIREHWFAPEYHDAGWKPIRTDVSPREQGYTDDKDIVWYRRRVNLPAHLPPHLYLYLTQQSKDFRLYIDGRAIEHSQVHWPLRVTYADI